MLGYRLRNGRLEYYRIEISDNGFLFIINEAFFSHIFGLLSKNERVSIFALERRHGEGLVTFPINLPFITFPNHAHKKIDWENLELSAGSMSELLWVFNGYLHEEETANKPFALSDDPQFMLIQTVVGRGEDKSACQIAAGFSEGSVKALEETYPRPVYFKDHVDTMYSLYLRLSESQKRKYKRSFLLSSNRYNQGFIGVSFLIREGGVPQFQVPGDCACLGASPDYFKENWEITDHNVDSSLQLITMLTGVVLFWNEVLKPLMKK